MRKLELIVPTPADPQRLDRFIAANVPELSRTRVKALLDLGHIGVDGRVARRAGLTVRPDQVVALSWRPTWAGDETPLGQDIVIVEGDGWLAVNKPAGVPTHRRNDEDTKALPERLSAGLGVDPTSLIPAHRLDRETSGVLLLARSSAAAATLGAAFERREVSKRYLAVVCPAPDQDNGDLLGPEDLRARYALLARSKDGARAELEVFPEQGRTHQIRRQLAAAGHPIVGDLEYGKPLPGGAPRMGLHCQSLAWAGERAEVDPPTDWTVLLEPSTRTSNSRVDSKPQVKTREGKVRSQPRSARSWPSLRVSQATARIVRGGHPWVIRDRDTGSLRPFKAGDVVDLVDHKNSPVATAVLDPANDICARVISKKAGAVFDEFEVVRRVEVSLSRRSGIVSADGTNAYRLIHGEGDGLPGLFVDRWAGILVATRTSRCLDGFADAVYTTLANELGLPIFEKDHLVDLRQKAEEARALPGRWRTTPPLGNWRSDAVVEVLEAGVRYQSAPLQGLATGFYPDQRDNRALVDTLVSSARGTFLNLFGHTGSFSVVAARAGAEKTVTVDLSQPYLDVAKTNFEVNGFSPHDHELVAADALEWLRECNRVFDGIVLDPPAFAKRRKDGDWSARRDYRKAVALAARALKPGGWMLCCHNLKGGSRGWFRNEISAGLEKAARAADLKPAPPSSDFPFRRSFPEGRQFEGVLLRI